MAGGKVRVRRVYEEPEPGDGTRVLVDRIWPRGLTKAKARVVAEMEIDAAAQRTVLQHRPAAAARRVAVIVSLPGELHARAPVPGCLTAIHPSLDGDEAEGA